MAARRARRELRRLGGGHRAGTQCRSAPDAGAAPAVLNTAKVMEDNPVALRLKELETLEKVTKKIDKISVYGGLDGALKDPVKIRGCAMC